MWYHVTSAKLAWTLSIPIVERKILFQINYGDGCMIFLGCSRYIYTATLPVKAGDFGIDFPCAFQPSTRRKEQRLSYLKLLVQTTTKKGYDCFRCFSFWSTNCCSLFLFKQMFISRLFFKLWQAILGTALTKRFPFRSPERLYSSCERWQKVNLLRSEERREGKECRSRWSPYH